MPELLLQVGSGDELDVRRFHVTESVSELFFLNIEAVSLNASLDLEEIVGLPASFALATGHAHNVNEGRRRWDGLVSFMEATRAVDGPAGSQPLSTYTLHLVPDAWRLTQRRNHRLFQHLSVPEIVDELLASWSVDGRWDLERSKYAKLELRTQYGETDYALMCRLLEEAGISFTFGLGATPSLITFTDQLQGGKSRGAVAHVDEMNEAAEIEYVTGLRLTREVRPGAVVTRDYDFRAPAFQLYGKSEQFPREEKYEQYHYLPGASWVEGGEAGSTPVADDQAVNRTHQEHFRGMAQRILEAERTGRATVHYATNAADLSPGQVFEIDRHPHADLGRSLVAIAMNIEGNSTGERWSMHGTSVFADEPFRTPPRTEKPNLTGVQTAKVVGPPGEEIHTDEFGRVRVMFPWDRDARSDDRCSCWMRVSQGWAGTGFGMMQIPRVGQEVLVTFLDGDPDQPVVVGRVFNAVAQVPYKLPENKTVSGWKTQSSPGGDGYNEIKLEDLAGLELFYIQAQRNLDKLVKNDETERTRANHKKTIEMNQDLVVKQTKKELIEIDDHLHVIGNRLQRIDQTTSLRVGVDHHTEVGNLFAVAAGNEIHMRADATVVVDAGRDLTIRGPGGFINIHSGGVDIVGKVVNINSGGSPGVGSGASPQAPADAQEAEPKDASH